MSAPTLLVGLGGAGGKVVERVRRMTAEEGNENISFVVFDTDSNELEEIKRRNPSIYTVQTSTNQKVGEYLSHDTHARDTWFPVNAVLNNKALSEGAGQVRSVSRLAFETAVRANKLEPLKQAIQNLFKVEENRPEQALRVIVVSSLAGGTGSGLVLPVALYIQNYLKMAFPGSSNIARGFFLLPEVFYEVIHGQTERNNLKANAYAALRELDAFMMKSDGKLPKQYEEYVKIYFPREASEGFEEFNVNPYDFCFLFDAQNAEGAKLNSHEQYLDHAATCIYAQSIGPMNRRSNSSEDNTIRSLARESGRNRYAGAGASMLIYPFNDIRRFIALNWAKLCVSDKWLEYDRRYKDVCKENARSRERGIAAQNPDEYSYYVSQIDSLAKNDDAFSKSIVTSCSIYDGVTKIGNRWDQYVKYLLLKVKEDICDDKNKSSLSKMRDDITDLSSDLSNDWSKYIELYNEEVKYYKTICAFVEEYSPTIAYSLFKKVDKGTVEQKLPYRLETYMMNTEGKFLHPNAIRYLLINIRSSLIAVKQRLDKDIERMRPELENENTILGLSDDQSEKAGVASLNRKEVGLIDKIKNRPTSEQAELADNLAAFMENIEKYKEKKAQQAAVTYGLTHIEKLLKAYSLFYRSFETKVATIEKELEGIKRRYISAKGSTKRFVCASEKCFDRIKEKFTYLGSYIDIDSELCENVYNGMRDYAIDSADLSANGKAGNKYFSRLFEEGIIRYYEKQVMIQYGSEIDVDIITAIENEFDYEHDFDQFDDTATETEQYVRNVINSTRKLACPFIERPIDNAGDGIDSCTFNDELDPAAGDESPRAHLVNSELKNFGAAPDKEISRYMITFYKSFYGLRANDLGKFAPARKTSTNDRPAGEYFKAYYELINHIHPVPHLSKEISPHIDKWWHIITKIPDLDEDNQVRQENRIYAAFFWGIISGCIRLTDETNKSKVYKIDKDSLKTDDDKLIVSNGTACDRLYEVLDAIAIYPELVDKILSKIGERVEYDVFKGKPFEKGLLNDYLGMFSMAEPGLGTDSKAATSVFSLPMLMKKSTTPDSYYEDSVIAMLRVEIEEIRRYLSRFIGEKDLPAKLGTILNSQFEKYLADVETEKSYEPEIYKGSLFFRVCATVSQTLEEIGLEDEARAIDKKRQELRK